MNRRTHPHRAVLVLAATGLALATAPLLPGAAAYADPPTCAGRAATIVGVPGQAVQGTSGADVIVATDPHSVDAGAGDDLVCVLSSGRTYLKPDIDLGAGADTYWGTGHIATVLDAGDGDDVRAGRAPSTDHITTGDLRDLVRTGADGYPDADVLDLGDAGDSRNRVYLSGTPTGSITSGALTEGVSELRLDDSHRHSWAVDLQAGTVTVDGGTPVSVTGFGELTARDLTWRHLSVVGPTSTPAFVDLGRSGSRRGSVAVHLGSADDQVRAPVALRGVVDLGGTATGPTGRDAAQLTGADTRHPTSRITLRLGASTRVGDRTGLRVVRADAVHVLHAAWVHLIGTAASEELDATACSADVHGSDGDDAIELTRAGGCRHRGPFAAYGNGGDDRLVGTPGPDTLIGGPGLDRACGHGGPDVIRAEQRC